MINQQYPNMMDVSGIGNGMQDTRSQNALHQALMLRTSSPQVQHNQQFNNLLAQALKQGKVNPTNYTNSTISNSAPVNDYSTSYNPATGQDWATTGSGYAGNGMPDTQYTGIDQWLANGGGLGYDSSGFAMNDYLGNLGLDGGGSFSGAGDFSLGGIGDSLGGAGDWFAGLGDWFGGLFSGSGALAGAGETAAEVAPAAAAAA